MTFDGCSMKNQCEQYILGYLPYKSELAYDLVLMSNSSPSVSYKFIPLKIYLPAIRFLRHKSSCLPCLSSLYSYYNQVQIKSIKLDKLLCLLQGYYQTVRKRWKRRCGCVHRKRNDWGHPQINPRSAVNWKRSR